MKIYFDDVISKTSPNCVELSKKGTIDFWLTSPGTRLKKELSDLNIPYYSLESIDEPGLYFIEVNGDPIWWTGLAEGQRVPSKHILRCLPENILNLVRNNRIKIIISADREGGSMLINPGSFFNFRDGFLATYKAMIKQDMPSGSVIIIQGNRKIEQQYAQWLTQTNNEKIFDVKYSNHFNRIFIDSGNQPPKNPIIYDSIKNLEAKDYNSLNRTYKHHRSAHLYYLAKTGMLEHGLVSANKLKYNDSGSLKILKYNTDIKTFDSVLNEHYPLFVDGDWSVKNAANSVNSDIFKNSLISFITETKFDEDVVFLTEKVYKSLTYGHPMIVLSTAGTLRALSDLGYRIDWCGIDPSYNDIEDHSERFYATHKVLQDWITLSREEKIKRILDSTEVIEHNFNLSAQRDFYHEDLLNLIQSLKGSFND